MNFTDKTFETLAPFERYFKTATEADWCPNPGNVSTSRENATPASTAGN